ncbi:MAG: esterase [Phycisphaerales bacterium]|nr:esterase [Phycisphaerales bacterium]MDB5302348.1 esterase [Phycisphaerales bacterium]
MTSAKSFLACALLLLCVPGAQAAPKIRWANVAATQPTGPVEKLSAKDEPLDLRGAEGDVAAWLKAFAVEPRTFEYTVQLLDEDENVRVYRLTFPSPFESPWPQNNVVPAEFFVPKAPKGKMRAAIVLDIMDGSAILARGLARGMAENGVGALYVPMAYYGSRRPKSDPHLKAFMDDPVRTLEALRQTVMDIRRAKAILASRGDVDPKHIGITGISLGGIMTSLAAGVDGGFDRVVPILAGGDLATMVFHTRETRAIRATLEARGVTKEQLAKMLAPVEPLHFASRIDPATCLMINASEDEVIPRDCTDALNRAIHSPQILWAQAGHYSSILLLPAIRQTAVRFLMGEKVSKIEF